MKIEASCKTNKKIAQKYKTYHYVCIEPFLSNIDHGYFFRDKRTQDHWVRVIKKIRQIFTLILLQ